MQHERVAAAFHRLADVRQAQRVALRDAVVIRLILERQRQNAIVDEVRLMNTGERLRDDSADTQIQRDKRGVFADANCLMHNW